MYKFTRRSRKAGLPPGTLVHIGERKTDRVEISAIQYNEAHCQEMKVVCIDEKLPTEQAGMTTWINVIGLNQLDIIETLGSRYGLHPLTLEDIVNTEQRPKIEDYEDYLFIVFKMLDFLEEGNRLDAEQVSLIVKPGLLISFQEREMNAFEPLWERIKRGKGKLRKEGSDYLAYGLIDAAVDRYFVVLEKIGERLEYLQEELIESPDRTVLYELQQLKRAVLFLRRSVWPLRDFLDRMTVGDFSFIQPTTQVYLRDAYDHVTQVMDIVENFREMLSSMLDIYLSSINNKLSEVMKLLTIISTIFIPLNFMAGVYGMNFKHMPELEWYWGYPSVLLSMLTVALSMLFYFHRKRWI